MRVRFVFDEQDQVEVEGYDQLNLLAHAQIAERSLQSRCGGQCVCSTCRVELVSGVLSEMRDPERELLGRVGVSPEAIERGTIRLACQAFPASPETEEVVIRVPRKKFSDARS